MIGTIAPICVSQDRVSLLMVQQSIEHTALATAIWPYRGNYASGCVAQVDREITKSLVSIF